MVTPSSATTVKGITVVPIATSIRSDGTPDIEFTPLMVKWLIRILTDAVIVTCVTDEGTFPVYEYVVPENPGDMELEDTRIDANLAIFTSKKIVWGSFCFDLIAVLIKWNKWNKWNKMK